MQEGTKIFSQWDKQSDSDEVKRMRETQCFGVGTQATHGKDSCTRCTNSPSISFAFWTHFHVLCDASPGCDYSTQAGVNVYSRSIHAEATYLTQSNRFLISSISPLGYHELPQYLPLFHLIVFPTQPHTIIGVTKNTGNHEHHWRLSQFTCAQLDRQLEELTVCVKD